MRNPGSLRRAVGPGVAAISMATAMIGGLQVVDQQPAEALPAHCSGIYDDFYDNDCREDGDTYNDPCNISGRYFDPFACYYPDFTDPPTGGGGGGVGGTPAPRVLAPTQHVPANGTESGINGPGFITPTVSGLVRNTNPDIIYKNEENNDQFPGNENTDSLMTPLLKARLDRLAMLVKAEFPGSKLRVTEAFDIDTEHSPRDKTSTEGVSLHYEGRAADISVGTSPTENDPAKLGRLGQLAVDAGFEWVHYETNPDHVHVSVPRDPVLPDTPPPPPPPAPRPGGCSGCTYEEP
jgi:hypothetical protein